jgi:hypothetical protein
MRNNKHFGKYRGIVINNMAQVLISDMAGPTRGILLKTMSGAMIAINDAGITISNGKGAVITMAGPTVDINSGALTVP